MTMKGDGDTNIELNGNNTVQVNSNGGAHTPVWKRPMMYVTGTLTIKDDKNDDGSEKDRKTRADDYRQPLVRMAVAIGGAGIGGQG